MPTQSLQAALRTMLERVSRAVGSWIPPRRRTPWNPAWSKKEKGRWGERAAEDFLWKEKGHRILARNFLATGGEVDLVTDDHGTLVFVEVKTRLEPDRNPPLLAVDEEKMTRVRRAASRYLRRIRPPRPPARIDLVGIVPDPETGRPHTTYLPAVAWFPADSPSDPARTSRNTP